MSEFVNIMPATLKAMIIIQICIEVYLARKSIVEGIRKYAPAALNVLKAGALFKIPEIVSAKHERKIKPILQNVFVNKPLTRKRPGIKSVLRAIISKILIFAMKMFAEMPKRAKRAVGVFLVISSVIKMY
jgi:hypothetical protein